MPKQEKSPEELDNCRELERARRKTRAVLSARFALERQLKRIDYDIDVIRPALSRVDEGAANGELPVVEAYEVTE